MKRRTMPMWLLSGALFPVSGAHSWIGWVMQVNPLTYGVAGLRGVLYDAPIAGAPPVACSVGVMGLFGVLAAGAGLRQASRAA